MGYRYRSPKPVTTIPVVFELWQTNRSGRWSRLVSGDQISAFLAKTETGFLSGRIRKFSTYFSVEFDGFDESIFVPESRGSRERIFNLAYADYLNTR